MTLLVSLCYGAIRRARTIARKPTLPRLPKNCEALDLSKQQKLICRMVLHDHLTAAEIAKRLNTTPKAIRNQIGRIWSKAEKTNKSVNNTGQGVNHACTTVAPEVLQAVFPTQVQKIVYLRSIGFGNRQIAEILGISDANVRQVLSRAKRQKVSRSFGAPIPIGPQPRPRNPIEEAVLLDGARMFYNKFVAGTNNAPTLEVLRGLHLTGQGGKQGAKLVLSDRAKIMRLLAELSYCKDPTMRLVRIDDDPFVRRACGKVLNTHFTQVAPGHYKPKDGKAIPLLRSTLESAIAEAREVR